MAKWRNGWLLAWLSRGRWARAWVLLAAVTMVLQLLQAGLLVPGLGPQAASASAPVAPPAPVNPDPKVVTVTAAGPTQVSGSLSADTVWSPHGSPYLVDGLTVPAGVELTLLPGTVVKLAWHAQVNVVGTLLALGDPSDHVVITSDRDDSVMGDSNGDGGATTPAAGDWYTVATSSGGDAVFDYADVRYGGWGTACYAYGELGASGKSELIVANSSLTDSANAGVDVGSGYQPYAGVYNSHFASSCMGVAAVQPGEVDVTGNTFDMPSGNTALFFLFPHKARAWFNTVNGLTAVAGDDPTTRTAADLRFNQLGGIYDYGAAGDQLNDWSDNWWGQDANAALPACLDPDVAQNSVPAVTVSGSSDGCPAGQRQVTGYTRAVLPALSASPLVLPAALREAAAPRFGPVDTYSGALTYQANDMDVQDAGKQISVTRTYRSDRLSGGDAGTGWRTAFDETLPSTGGGATLSLPDGSSVGFATDPAAGYTPAPGVSSDFTTGAGGSTVTSPNQVGYQFNPSGELTGIDLGDVGHHLTIDHAGGHVSKVTGVSGRYVNYSYNGGQLASATDQSNREVDLFYTGGRLTSVKGVDGNSETYGYDADGHLTSVTTPKGRTKLAAHYNPDGRVDWIEQEGGGRTTFSYDDADGKRLITLADGTVITQLYDFAGRLVSEQLGSTGTHVVYDGEGHVVASITGVPTVAMTGYGPSANVTMFDGHGDPYLTADPMGNVTTTTFNSRHEPLVITSPDGTTVSNTYSDDGRLAEVIDPRGKHWAYTYNSYGEVKTQTDPLLRVRTVSYDPSGNGDAISLTDETGTTTSIGYDPQGRPNSVTDPMHNETDTTYTPWDAVKTVQAPGGGLTTSAYNDDRQQISVTNPLTKATTYDYDTQGRLTTTTDPLTNPSVIAYDILGRPKQLDDAGSLYKRSYTPEGWVDTSTDPDGKVTSYDYDPAGRPIRVTDPMGAVTQTVYDRNGNITEIDRPDGSVQTWAYDSMGRQVRYTLPRGGVQATTYDESGNVTSVLGPRALTTFPFTMYGVTATYDDAGRLASRTDAMGTTTTYSYDDATRTVTATDPRGVASVVAYDADGRVAARTDGAGGTTHYAYDPDSNVAQVTDPTGRTTSSVYDLAGQLTSQTDPAGHPTTYGYDADGRTTTITYPLQDTETYHYDATGNVTDYGDRNGNHWTSSYDTAGHLLTATDPLGHVTTYSYDDDGRQASVTDASGVVTNTAYDPVGRLAVTSDVTGASWVTSYDKDGNVSSAADPDGVSWAYSYDTADQLATAQWSGASRSYSYSYDNAGRLTQKSDPYTTSYDYTIRGQVKTVTDAQNNTTTNTYDGAGRLLSTELPSGHTSSATYDDAGRIKTATDGAGDTSQYDYNTNGQLGTTTLPRGGTYHYTYDADGWLATQTDPLGVLTSYDFNGLDQPTSITYPSGRAVTFGYDAANRQTSQSSGTVTRTFGYDPAGRPTSATVTGQSGSPPALSWAYNNLGLMTSSTDALGTTSYSYDPAGRVTTKTPPVGAATTITYNSQGLPASFSGATSMSLDYNSAGQVTDELGGQDGFFLDYNSNGQLTSTGDTSATYNTDGQIATLTQHPTGNPASNTTTYSYDDAGRLSSAALAQGGTTVSTASYSWDADSNRTLVSTTGQPDVTTHYNLADQATTDTAGTSYTYDADGNLTSAAAATGTTTYTYGPFGDPTGSTGPSGNVTDTPDALGRTAVRDSGGDSQTFSYEGTSTTLAAQQDGTGTTTNLIYNPADSQLLAEASTDGTTLRANPTIHGDIARLVNPSGGATAWTAVYDPFGAATTTGTAPVSLGFQSMYTDPTTSLTDMGARDYNPADGTFTTVDSFIGDPLSPPSLNRYLYGDGDPLDFFDPDGYFGCSSLPFFQSQCEYVANKARQLWDGATSKAKQVWHHVTSEADQAYNYVTQQVDTVKTDLTAVIHQASQVIQVELPTIKAAAASLAVGGLVFLGCEAVTAGVGSIGCATIASAAGNSLYSAMTCPAGTSTLHCAATGALTGAAAGLTGGIATELGASDLIVGALANGAANATGQLTATGHIDPGQLAKATLTGAALGSFTSAGGKVLNRPGIKDPTGDNPTTPETTPTDPEPAPQASSAPETVSDQGSYSLKGVQQELWDESGEASGEASDLESASAQGAGSAAEGRQSLRDLAEQVRLGANHPAAANQRVIAIGEDSQGGLHAGSSAAFDAGQRAVLRRLGIGRVPAIPGYHAEEEILNVVPDLQRIGVSGQPPCGPESHDCLQQLTDAGVEIEW